MTVHYLKKTTTPPNVRETILYSDNCTYIEEASQLAPGQTIEITVFSCPSCKKNLPPLVHGCKETCDCGLAMMRHGNALEVWR